ncbi:MAG: glycosyltransferase family 39 protein [Planctomyces sp.]|nr:glycosyltransferase family 39 protein [Planctomyces sp.]
MLTVHAVWLAWSATWQSPTLNEPGHLISGIAHWKFGRFEPYRVNPPLVRMVAAAPVLWADHEADWSGFHEAPGARSEFALGLAFIKANGAESQRLFVWARWACIPFSLLGGWVCYRWSGALFGPLAGLLSLAVWCCEPNLIAHGQLLTPDAGATAGGLLAGYSYWSWLRQRDWGTAALAAGGLGLALVTKFSWLILLGLWPLLWLAQRVVVDRRRGASSVTPCRDVAQLVVILVGALYLVNVAYGFDGTLSRVDSFEFVSRSFSGADPPERGGNRFRETPLAGLPVPLPRQFVLGVDLQKKDFEHYPHRSYLRGEWKQGGWPHYYAYAALAKLPLGVWLLLLTAAWRALLTRGALAAGVSRADLLPLIVPGAALFVLVSSQQEFNHHFRYVLPCVGLAAVFCGGAIGNGGHGLRVWCAACAAWACASSLWVAPCSLSFFNELAGGPAGGAKHLLHSNIDWGQDLWRLDAWRRAHPEATPLTVAYYGFYLPSEIGVDIHPAAGGPFWGRSSESVAFQPGWCAVSVNYLYGCEWLLADRELYTLLQSEPIAARCGGSILVYRIDETLAARLEERRQFHIRRPR